MLMSVEQHAFSATYGLIKQASKIDDHKSTGKWLVENRTEDTSQRTLMPYLYRRQRYISTRLISVLYIQGKYKSDSLLNF